MTTGRRLVCAEFLRVLLYLFRVLHGARDEYYRERDTDNFFFSVSDFQ